MQRMSRFSKLVHRGGPGASRAQHIGAVPSIIRVSRVGRRKMSERIRLGVLMDPIADIKYAKDSTLAMLLAAQARGFQLSYMEQADLSLRDGKALARLRPLTVSADESAWFVHGEARVEALGELDCV